ncbi:MAG TPA: triose-phosphate isomerase [Erysipelothrix sp.]|nr:triose-phosphate isomerase [Erysipelothrix sp.]
MRKPIIVGNWKMNKRASEAKEFVQAIEPLLHDQADFGIAPAYIALAEAKNKAENLIVAAQNVHWEPSGAYTGEVSIDMLKELGIEWVILGHSERRQYFNETDETVNKKVLAVLEAGLKPIVCVGETLDEFEGNQTEEVVRRQVADCFAGVEADKAADIVVAYEPVWAIGTGKSATTEIAQNTCALVRDELKKVLGEEAAETIRIQYGGSVKPDNIKDYMAQPDIDGALIGGASLKVDSYKEIIDALL